MRISSFVALLLCSAALTAQTPPEEGLDAGAPATFSSAAEDSPLNSAFLIQLEKLRDQVVAQRAANPSESGVDTQQIEDLSAQIETLRARLDRLRDQRTFQNTHRLLTLPPTRLGWGLRRHESRAGTLDPQGYGGLTFDLNVGVSALVSDKADLSRPGSWVWGANLLYSGIYDFRMDLYSGPVLSRVQNPQFGFFIDGMGTRGTITQNLFAGWAHESNGQYASSSQDFGHLAAIDPLFRDQFFASMGWDYYFVRYTRFFRWDAISLMPHVEVRHLMRQAQGNPMNVSDLEDKANITGLTIHGSGIRAYDGLRVGSLFTIDEHWHGSSEVILPSLWALNRDYRPLEQVGFEATVYYEGVVTPYLAVRGGTRLDPAYYFAHEWSFSAGLAIQTSDFWPK